MGDATPLAPLRAALDRALIGHSAAKAALEIGWLARVPVLIEGAPGCGKATLVRAFADTLGLCASTRRDHVTTAITLTRRALPGGERLQRAPARHTSPAERAELDWLDALECVGSEEATRLAGSLASPRFCVGTALRIASVATLATLRERFVLKIHMRGLLASGHSAACRRLLERTLASDPACDDTSDVAALERLRDVGTRLPIDAAVLERMAEWLARPDRGNLPRSDVAALGALTSLLRALAVRRGASRVDTRDLESLATWLGGTLVSGADAGQGDEAVTPGVVSSSGATAAESAVAGAAAAATHEASVVRESALPVDSTLSPRSGESGAVESLVRALSGRLERGGAGRRPDPAGAPRRRRALHDFDELQDADPVELWSYLDLERSEPPSVLARARRGSGSALAILRDVSASMDGPGARWSLRLVRALVEAARERGLRAGYLEFNHDVERFTWHGRFLHRGYGALLERASRARCTGRTNYQAALRAALAGTGHAPRGTSHFVLITDGVPVAGDPWARAERAAARARGIAVHSVFVGLPPAPELLGEIAEETGGLSFCVLPRPSGSFVLHDSAADAFRGSQDAFRGSTERRLSR